MAATLAKHVHVEQVMGTVVTFDVRDGLAATYTSLSYEGSLQSALDKLGFKSADGNAASTDMSQLQ